MPLASQIMRESWLQGQRHWNFQDIMLIYLRTWLKKLGAWHCNPKSDLKLETRFYFGHCEAAAHRRPRILSFPCYEQLLCAFFAFEQLPSLCHLSHWQSPLPNDVLCDGWYIMKK